MTNSLPFHYTKGIVFTLLFALLSIAIVQLPFLQQLSISPLIVAIILGLVYGNTLHHKTPDSWRYGIIFSQGMILRLGIILFGFRISFQEIAAVGLYGLLIDIFIVISTLALGYFAGTKLLRINAKTSLLTAMGSAICGAAAIIATKPIVNARSHHVSIAVATVVIFGTLAMFLYPILINLFNLDDTAAGIYIGATIHEVAQVVAAGSTVSEQTMETAVVVKLTRVLLLAPVILLLSWWIARSTSSTGSQKFIIPWFAFGFIAAAGINSFDIVPAYAVQWIHYADTVCLSMAMAALGMETNFKKIKNVGAKPFMLAFVLFMYRLASGYLLVYWL